MKEHLHLEVSKLLGEPINYQLPVPVELQEICNIETVEPGEKVFVYEDVDTDKDQVLGIDSDGNIRAVKKTPLGDAQVSLTGLQSRLEYVNIDDLLSKPDLKILGRKKERIAHAMDKKEVKAVLDGILSGGASGSYDALEGARPDSVTIPSVAYSSGDDIYDLILKAKQEIEDDGDNYVLLTGSTVQNRIDLYDKAQAATHNYNVDLKGKLAKLGIKEVKIWGKVERLTTDGTTDAGEQRLLDTNKFILLARNSRVASGKPVTFVRRKIDSEIARLMGANVDKAQRANIALPTPVQDNGNKLAIGVYGYESICFVIPNPKAICFCDAENAL